MPIEDLGKMVGELLLDQKLLLTKIDSLEQQIADMRNRLPESLDEAGWLDTTPAATALASAGVRSIHHLRELVYAGVFTEGEDIRDRGNGRRHHWQFNIPKCKVAISRYYQMTPEQRALLRSA